MQLVKIEPERLEFQMLEKEPQVTLQIENTSDKTVAFKVKTTHPKRYLVRPNQDVIAVGEIASVRITLQIRDAKALRQQRITGGADTSDDARENRFLVQSLAVREPFLDRVQSVLDDSAPAALQTVLKDVWAASTKDEFVNRKLDCAFKYPRDMNQLLEANLASDAHAPGGSAGVPYAVPVEAVSGSGDGAAAAKGNGAAGSGEGAVAGAGDGVADLRKKYNELINFTVQLTAERDRFKAALKDATREMAQLRKGGKGPNAQQQQQQRQQEAGGQQDRDGGPAQEAVVGGGAFGLWQVLLVAILAFLLGRLLV